MPSTPVTASYQKNRTPPGEVRVFFELNGQPRVIKVADNRSKKDVPAHPKADNENPITSVPLCDLLLTLGGMKMEVAIHAERPGTTVRLLAKVGSQVDAKDLLVELQDK